MKNALFITILSTFSLALFFPLSAYLKCNGYSELCDRRYNEIAQIDSHNATSNTFSLVQDQDRSIAQQLGDGIRVFKIPIHFDYVNVLGYYAAVLKAYSDALDEKIQDRITYLDEKRAVLQAQAEQSLKKEEEEIQQAINKLKEWYDNLPTFSLTGGSKGLRSIDYAAQMGFLEAKKKALMVKYADLSSLTVNPDADPHLLELKAEKALIKPILKQIQNKEGKAIFICHGLAKGELYRHVFSSEEEMQEKIKKAPPFLQPLVKRALLFIHNLPPNFFKGLYGSQSPEEGRLLPYTPCTIDPSKILLKDFLHEIYMFLENNPHEVITIKFNDFLYNPDALAQVVQESGLLKYAYTQDKSKAWPTLGELIRSGKRLLLFTDAGDVEKEYPWLMDYKFYTEPWHIRWNFKTVDELINPQHMAEWGNLNYQDTEEPFNKILAVHHTVTPRLAGNKETAAIINARPVLRERMKLIAQQTNHIPNLISLDFYEHPHNDAFDVIEELNGVGNYEGRPLWKKQNEETA